MGETLRRKALRIPKCTWARKWDKRGIWVIESLFFFEKGNEECFSQCLFDENIQTIYKGHQE
ncbi:hypothetical protein CEV08_06775 [Bartonella tribocorum]|uniref:Uncharacterized protein n=1 Tax=Bartonella tribocorum TaxID=85701 RepID=A0A2M6USN0_9HYPH|nr:hypothetical protein CEV08_06775 [Bartonella tribocorum]